MTLTVHKNKKIAFYTLGCRLNQAETTVIQNSFNIDGYDVVGFSEPADIAVVNTCTVTENGDADTRKLVNKARRLNTKVRIALIGCQAQVQKGKLGKLPNVQWVIGNAKKFDLLSIINKIEGPAQAQVITPSIPRESFTMPIGGIDRNKTRANLKIQDGCDFFCSFCEIPFARGRARSRVFSNIIDEARFFADEGYKEIVLTGINLGTYRSSRKTLINVIRALDQIPKLERIRISSIEPTTLDLRIIRMMAGNSKLCRYLHIPIQSGSDKILGDMQRKYRVSEYDKFIADAAQLVPGICIGTDVIAGFPGETDEYFEETYQYLKNAPISYFHVFSYSRRYMAKSKKFKNEVPDQVIQKRSRKLRDLSARKRKLFYSTMLGKTEPILCEQSKNGFWTGVTENYSRVSFKSAQNLKNKLVSVRLEKLGAAGIEGVLA